MDGNNNNSCICKGAKHSLLNATDDSLPNKRRYTLTLEVSLAEGRDDLHGITASIVCNDASEKEIVGVVQEPPAAVLTSAAAAVENTREVVPDFEGAEPANDNAETANDNVEPATKVIEANFECKDEVEFRAGLDGKRTSDRTLAATSSDVEDEVDEAWYDQDSTHDDDPADWTVLTADLVMSPNDTPNDSFDVRHMPGFFLRG